MQLSDRSTRCRDVARALSSLAALLLGVGHAAAIDPAMARAPEILRPVSEIMHDWDIVSEQARGVLRSPAAYPDAQSREDVAPAAKPVLRKAIEINTQMYHARRDGQLEARRNHYHLLAILAFLDDAQAIAELKEARESNHKEIARFGRRGWYLAQWWRSAGDEKACSGLLDEIQALADATPGDDDLAAILLTWRQEGTATGEQDQRIQEILSKRLTGRLAQVASAEFRAAQKRKSLVGKPLVIRGQTLDGKLFSSETLKGKHIIVHLGATWCGPWVSQHERLLQMEMPADVAVVTILADEKQAEVDAFIERHKAIPWAVLRDPRQPATLPALYGVETFPNTILIAPDGTVKAVDIEPGERMIASLVKGDGRASE